MADVFISYARENNAEALLLQGLLQESGFSVWRDNQLEPRKRWDAQIEEQLAEAKAVVVLWTPHAARSEWVRIEAEFARNSGKLVPTLCHTCDVPIAFSLIQAVDLRGWMNSIGEDNSALLVSIIQKMVRSAVPASGGDDDLNVICECKWTGWHTNGATIVQGFKYFGSAYNFEMSLDWIAEKSGIRLPGMPMRTLLMFFVFLSIKLDEQLTDFALDSEDGRRSTGLMPARAQHTDNGGAIVGLLARADVDKTFDWLAGGEDLVARFMVRNEAVLVVPVPYSPGLREHYDAVRKRLR